MNFDSILLDDSDSPDEKAEKIIKMMVGSAAAAAIIPAHVNWALFATALGGGVVGIGAVYGHKLDNEDGWKLVKQFIGAAGWTFVGLTVGSKILAALITSTGLGYPVAVALDASISAAIAYAVGCCGRVYFRGEHNKARLGEAFRSSFLRKQSELKGGQHG